MAGADPETVTRLIDRIDVDRLVGRLVDLVQIPSVNPFGAPCGPFEGEAGVAEYMGNHLADLGWPTSTIEVEPGRPNVWGVRPGGDGPTVLLAGHTDTVGVTNFSGIGPAPRRIEPSHSRGPEARDRDLVGAFSGEITDGRVHGRGACDMKAALAAYLELATVLEQTGAELGGDLVIAGLVDEEHKLLGSRSFATDGPTADYAIIGEPTSLVPCPAHLGQFSLVITTKGRASHSSIPEQGVNAIEHMARVIEALGRYRDEILNRAPHPLCGTGRINSGVIHGGDIVAIVPDSCHLEVDRRLTPDDRPEEVIEDLRRYLDELARSDANFSYELSPPTWDVASLDTPIDSPVTLAVCRAADRLGLPSEPVAFRAATDGPNLAIPTVICGPGALERAHTVDEWVDIAEVRRSVELYAHSLFDLSSVPSAGSEAAPDRP